VGGTVAVADVVSAEDAGKAALQNAIEVLRDPSHVHMLSGSELVDLITRAGVAIDRQESWDKAREFEAWAGTVANPERVAPLRTVVRALAEASQDAGSGLSLHDGAVHFFIAVHFFDNFFYRWQLVWRHQTCVPGRPRARRQGGSSHHRARSAAPLLACRSWVGPRPDAATTPVVKGTMPG